VGELLQYPALQLSSAVARGSTRIVSVSSVCGSGDVGSQRFFVSAGVAFFASIAGEAASEPRYQIQGVAT